jgi:hypothetical protein
LRPSSASSSPRPTAGSCLRIWTGRRRRQQDPQTTWLPTTTYNLNALNLWKFHVDFTSPPLTTLTGPTSIPVTAFTAACGGGTCIPQPGTSQQLDSLADRLMYRLAYRNFTDHEALVVNHSVAVAGGVSAIRWYELRNPGGTPSVYCPS